MQRLASAVLDRGKSCVEAPAEAGCSNTVVRRLAASGTGDRSAYAAKANGGCAHGHCGHTGGRRLDAHGIAKALQAPLELRPLRP